MLSKTHKICKLTFASMFPQFVQSTGTLGQKIRVISSTSSTDLLTIPQNHRQQFNKNKKVQAYQLKNNAGDSKNKIIKTLFIGEKNAFKEKIKKNCQISFSQEVQNMSNFYGIASSILANSYIFSRKEKQPDQIKIQYQDFKDKQYILELVNANLRAKQWVNMRGDEATPQYFLNKAQQIAQKQSLKITIIKGEDLIKEGFRLMHAVGRASEKQPVFVNLSYNGNPESQEWISFVGKGVCFDSGGLNIKPTSGIKQMHMDKHGAASVLSAIQSVAKLKLKINLTVSMGFVQNFLSANSYRPLDIIKSRKGISVEIGNTDAQGRLVLADCMNWTQQKYKVKNLIELSTLTGAIIVALGKKHAGLFSNSDKLSIDFIRAGQVVNQQSWRMPVDDYHHDMIKSKHADITNSAGKSDAASSQAAAFLQKFVQKNVQWIHLDIAGTSNVDSQATGYGSKALIQYIKNLI